MSPDIFSRHFAHVVAADPCGIIRIAGYVGQDYGVERAGIEALGGGGSPAEIETRCSRLWYAGVTSGFALLAVR